ncbi:alpha/beta hydrolase [Ichthyenterobacterium sp. W332]|uniref:Proline iminopeptidase n=1 Tax=Microcosmobacter mediterraneus TaxID=3075607 RepID=A0ABU2YH39_9FLAO|nr:alpha/beta hydrolase [Ichthyenterobacterium sp. W332]MDT0557479.1 alpha/beta hydrolase [Ichthyenterobacterium sp. W332]
MRLQSLLLCFLFLATWSCQSQDNDSCEFKDKITIPYDDCGYVEVPNTWSDLSQGYTKIAYIVFKSKSENPKEDPVVFVQGGPGGNVLPSAHLYANINLDADRDFILYDQRGIGFSNEICPGLSASFLELMASDITLDKEDEALLEASSDCIKSLKDQSFKMAFGTTESAKDLEALRKHLGYKQLNLFGGSYGTRLSMKYMELYPNSVRTAILSGLFPPEIRLYDKIYTNINRSIELLFTTCKQDADCNTKYPNLKLEFEAICKALDKQPKTFLIGETNFVINKQDFLLLLQQLLYDRQTIANTPNFIMAFKSGNTEVLSQSIQAFAARLSVINVATYWSVNSLDEKKFKNKSLLQKDAAQYPLLSSGISLFGSDPDVMKHWPSNTADQTPMIALKSDIPTLLISGEWDPVTPPSNGEIVLKSLKNGSHVVFPNDGHCPINLCFFNMAKGFLNNPLEKVDDACAKTPNPIQFN